MQRIIIYSIVLILGSCNSSRIIENKKQGKHQLLTPVEYVQWVEAEENGLKIRQQEGRYIYELQYQPLEYLTVLQEKSNKISDSVLKQGIEERGNFQYFTFKMSTVSGKGILSDKDVAIENKEHYLLSGLQQDMMLLSGKDTLQCVMLHFESSNNFIPYDLCVLAFEPSEQEQDITFLFHADKYADDWVRIPIERQNINRIPKLKTK